MGQSLSHQRCRIVAIAVIAKRGAVSIRAANTQHGDLEGPEIPLPRLCHGSETGTSRYHLNAEDGMIRFLCNNLEPKTATRIPLELIQFSHVRDVACGKFNFTSG